MEPSVEIVEVSARDGLQNESAVFETSEKVRLIEAALSAGLKRLEVASFVNPKRVPQMADGEAVIAALPDKSDVTYIGLVLNKRGLLRALETRSGGKRGVDEVGLVAVATDTFAQRNQGQTSLESAELCRDMLALASREGMRGQVTLSASFGCPFEGRVSFDHVINMATIVAEGEPVEIAIADTIGVASPARVTELVERLGAVLPEMPLRAHFHNTRGTGLANAYAAYHAGVKTLDASIGGLGGCPFAPKATGNISTEELVYMLEESGIGTGVDLARLLESTKWIESHLGRRLPSLVAQAGAFPTPEVACL
ncbi:hydroxymethylglutaryl-CoA lyase [Kordiimonas sp.]|uniref:hydroxymethylglutaryl-CoA lyase n=1 Tax=Kordiimonas sp. TaxID=1970157 RepID=UPI003A90E1E1